MFDLWLRPFPLFDVWLWWWGASPPAIRLLRGDKADACAELHAADFAYPWSEDEIARLIVDPATIPLGALDPVTGALRGFAIVRLAADEAEILTIAVAAWWRKRGIGRAMLLDALRRAEEGGARAMFLEVDEANAAALALYRRLGFAEVGQRPGYSRRKDGSRALAIVMRKDLR